MAVDVLLGLQWGDEGKGKIVDVLAPQYQMVSRFQGGPNAGHTLEFDGIKHVLHQVPSGVFRKDIKNVVGNGVVLDPVIFAKELEKLDEMSIDFRDNLFVSKKAQLILPTHRLLDAAYEKSKGDKKIGSTLKGIGPTYQDKTARVGLRVGDVLCVDFDEKLKAITERHKAILDWYQFEYNLEPLMTTFKESVEKIKKLKLVDSEYVTNSEIKDGGRILAEGAQGALLDVDFGSYPFVTSSNTITAGACTGLGVAPSKINEVFGIFKAYCTRVGSGPFPTELNDEVGEKIRKEGGEFGATTGRPRRCGWLDLPALKYSIMLNGTTQLFMTKADVLSAFSEIFVCTHYEMADGTTTDQIPYDLGVEGLKPVYRSFKGWDKDLSGITTYEELPAELHDYVDYLEKELEVPINIVSVGPDREQTIFKNEVVFA